MIFHSPLVVQSQLVDLRAVFEDSRDFSAGELEVSAGELLGSLHVQGLRDDGIKDVQIKLCVC